MPCTITGSLDGDLILNLQEALEEVRKSLDLTTRAACEFAGFYYGANTERSPSPEAAAWWEKHKQEDSRRCKPKGARRHTRRK